MIKMVAFLDLRLPTFNKTEEELLATGIGDLSWGPPSQVVFCVDTSIELLRDLFPCTVSTKPVRFWADFSFFLQLFSMIIRDS